jgi:hypothetical protein
MNASSVQPARRAPVLATLLLVAGSFGFAAAWVLVAFARDRQCSWMALLAALDAVAALAAGPGYSSW